MPKLTATTHALESGLPDRSRDGRPRSRWQRAVAVATGFWLLPAVGFSIMTALGHPPMTGDDVLQNYPLRVFVGQLLRHGRLPLWDPYIWSGAPLLAGSNAGAGYPTVVAFALLPGPWAWTLNLVLVYGVAGSGLYTYLRSRGRCAAAAFGGGLAFAYSGFLTAQFVHLGLAQGVALVPWLMLAARRARQLRWSGALGLCLALIVLTGDPRALTVAAVVAAVTAVHELWQGKHQRRRYLAGTLTGLGVGLSISAFYWIPALADVYSSQRAHATYQFFSSGSVLPVWLLLVLMPYLLGSGSSLWTLFFGSYNLTELASYTGIFSLAAAGALIPVLLRRRRGWTELLYWYSLLVVGLLLALGGNTPLGHVLADLPVYGEMRLQSRNLAIVDLALAGVLAHWLDVKFAAPRRQTPLRWRERVGYLVPAALVAAITGFVLAAPGTAASWLRTPFPYFRAQWHYYATAIALTVVAGWLAGQAPRLAPGSRRKALLAFLAADMALCVAGTGWSGPSSATLAGATPEARAVAALLPSGQRFAVYDPWGSHPNQLQRLGAPDLNVLRSEMSVQGYGSVVNRSYDAATGTHQQNSLNPAALTSGVLYQLRLGLLLAPAQAFVVAAGSGNPTPPQPVATPVDIPPGSTTARFIGPPVSIEEVVLSAPGASPRSLLTATLVGPTGARESLTAHFADGLSVIRFATRRPAVALELTNRGSTQVQVGVVDVLTGNTLLSLQGPLVSALRPRDWRYVRMIGAYAAYRSLRVGPQIRIIGAGRARLTQVHPGPRPASVTVSAVAPVGVVRDVAYSPGWVALARHPGSTQPTLELPVRAEGVLQLVNVPAGVWQLRYEYQPSLVWNGGLISLAGLVLLALLWSLPLLRRKRLASAGKGGVSP